MTNIVSAFVLMAISAFIAIQIGQRMEKSKTFVYAFGLGIMLVQIAVLFTIRDWDRHEAVGASLAEEAIATAHTARL
jgi:hypothetical protein